MFSLFNSTEIPLFSTEKNQADHPNPSQKSLVDQKSTNKTKSQLRSNMLYSVLEDNM